MTEDLTTFLTDWLGAGGSRLGEAAITRGGAGQWLVTHHLDAAEAGRGTLRRHERAEAARAIALHDADGAYRPLKSAPSLIRGWELVLPDTAALRLALDFLYPAAVGNLARWRDGGVTIPTLRETLGRQTGMYKCTALLTDDEAQRLVAETCESGSHCLRRILWPLDAEQGWRLLPVEKTTVSRDPAASFPEMPLLCTDACPLLVGGARDVVTARRKAEREAAAAATESTT